MIISASRRTDIPTFYSEWFINRIKEGFLYVRNPVNPNQVSRIELSPEVVDCIVFWTKNPIPMLPRINELKGYHFYFQFTLTGYGKDIEGNLPDKKKDLIPAFQKLSNQIGPERVIWRYDPILFNERYTEEYHLRAFSTIAEALKGYTEKCVISFVDVYKKNEKALQEISRKEEGKSGLYSFAEKLYEIASANGMALATCAEQIELASIGIEHNACIDRNVIERITGCRMDVKKDPAQRSECMCVSSIEVGTYNSCGNGCKYCYANYDPKGVRKTMAQYDPNSPILCDSIGPDDKTTDRPMRSLLDKQVMLGI